MFSSEFYTQSDLLEKELDVLVNRWPEIFPADCFRFQRWKLSFDMATFGRKIGADLIPQLQKEIIGTFDNLISYGVRG